MALPSTPPTVTQNVTRRGDRGWLVFALQSALKTTAADGIFGPDTERALIAFQGAVGLVADGIAGPLTQAKIATMATDRAETIAKTPVGLTHGLALSESSLMLGTVNWSVDGGVDCGLMQMRVKGPPFSLDSMKLAFDPFRSADISIAALKLAAAGFAVAARGKDAKPRELEWRLAAMAHNWPADGGADYIAIHGKCSNPDAPCGWVPRDAAGRSRVRFPDGTRVETRWEWCQFYAMGGPHGEGATTRFVEEWSP
jgi:hypothetical protein